MNLDPKIAETIVNNLKDVINHEINLFDTTGTIIASTDPARIGTTHEGARLAIETQQPVPIDSEHQFKGAKHGINMPVMFQDTAAAVIGITGERAEVEPFGNVIKKMTEILIRENWDHVERYDRRVRVSNLAGILKLRHHDESLAAYYASMLRVDLDIPRLVLVGRAQAEDDSALDYNGLYEMFHARFESFKTSFFAFLERDICLFIDVRDERRISALVNGMSDDARRILGLPLILAPDGWSIPQASIGAATTRPAARSSGFHSSKRGRSCATKTWIWGSSSPLFRATTPCSSSATCFAASVMQRSTNSSVSSMPMYATTAASYTAPMSSICIRTRCRIA